MTHDVVAEALRRGFDDWEPGLRAWLRGAIRRRAAFLARSTVRRRRREERFGSEQASTEDAPGLDDASTFFHTLPPSLRSVSVLLAAGMSRSDVCHVLNLGDAAFRQRLSQLRKRWPAEGVDAAPPANPDLEFGPLRRALLHTLRKDTRIALGAHDPDGHLLFFTPSGPKST